MAISIKQDNGNKPLPRKQRVINRGTLLARTKDDVKNPSVTLMDMDGAILHYFDKVIQPSVEDNGENVKVPVMYASPERWKAIQRDGFMKDKKRQTITPVIAYRRTSIEKDEALPIDKLDANNPHQFYTFEKKFSDVNRYDNFSTQIGLLPQREYYNVTMPDYVTITYDFIIWTSYIEQMNKIVERVVYSDGAYWGDPDKMKFRTSVDTFTDATEVSDVERLVRTNFTVTMRGYLLPQGNFDHRSTTQKYLTPKKVIFGTEVDTKVSNTTGKTGQFISEIQNSSEKIGAGSPTDTLGTTLTFPLVLNAGTGVTLSRDGIEFNGASRLEQTISIGQDVSTTANVTFNQVSASSLILDSTTYDGGNVTGDMNFTGSLTTTGNMTVNGNATVAGIVTAQEFHTEFISGSIIYASGSTQFGDTLDDTHNLSGSSNITGSFGLNGASINEISNDTALADASSTAIATENAIKQYFIDTGIVDKNTYNRKSFVHTGSFTSANTSSFTAVTASAPTGLSGTTEEDFMFFINGMLIENDALTINQKTSTNLELRLDTSGLGYELESDDEVIGFGKFNS